MLTELIGAGVCCWLSSSRSASKLSKQQLALQQRALDFNKARYRQARTPAGHQSRHADGLNRRRESRSWWCCPVLQADMSQQFKNADAQILMNPQRMGINPNSGMRRHRPVNPPCLRPLAPLVL